MNESKKCQHLSSCSHSNTEIREIASGPHIAGMYCADCGRWIRWISKKEFYQLLEVGGVK